MRVESRRDDAFGRLSTLIPQLSTWISDRDGFEGVELPERLLGFGGEFVQGFDFGFAEEETASGRDVLGPAGFELAGEHRLLVAVAEDVIDHRFDVLLLI